VLNLYHRGPKRVRVPLWLRKLVVNKVMKENEKNLSDIIADSQAENESSKDKSSPKKPFNFPLDFASKSHVRRASDHYDNIDEATANLILSPLTKGSLPSGHIVQIEISKIKQQSDANPKLGILKSNHVKKQNNDVREVNRNVKVQDSNEIAVEDDNEYCSSNCFTTKHHKCNNNNIQNSTEAHAKFSAGRHLNNNASQENDGKNCYFACSANDVLLTTSNNELLLQDQKHKSRQTARDRDEDYVYEFLLETMNDLNQRQKLEDIEKQIIKEWRIVASIVDRILFWIFLIMTLGLTLTCLVFVPLSNK